MQANKGLTGLNLTVLALSILFLTGCSQAPGKTESIGPAEKKIRKRLSLEEAGRLKTEKTEKHIRDLLLARKWDEAAEFVYQYDINSFSGIIEVLDNIIKEKTKAGATFDELEPFYRFPVDYGPLSRCYPFGYFYVRYRAALIEGKFGKLPRKNPEKFKSCSDIAALVKEEKYGGTLEQIRAIPSSHRDEGMCALSMARALIAIFRKDKDSIEEAEKLLIEFAKKFPDAPILTPTTYWVFYRVKIKKRDHDLVKSETLKRIIAEGKPKGINLHEMRSCLSHTLSMVHDDLFEETAEMYRLMIKEDPRRRCRMLAAQLLAKHLHEDSPDKAVGGNTQWWRDTRKAFEYVIDKYPDGAEARENRAFLIGEIETQESLDNAIAYYRKVEEFYKGKELPGKMITALAANYWRSKDSQKAIDTYRKVTDRGIEEGQHLWSLGCIAKIYHETGDNKSFVEHATKLANAPDPGSFMTMMTSSTYRQEGIKMLIGHYLETKNRDKALEWLCSWKPENWCGTCLGSDLMSKEENILSILSEKGYDNDSALLLMCEKTRVLHNLDETFPLLEKAAEKGELDELMRKIEGFPRHSEPFKVLCRMSVPILKDFRNGSYEKLIGHYSNYHAKEYVNYEKYVIDGWQFYFLYDMLTDISRELFLRDKEKARSFIRKKLLAYDPKKNNSAVIIELVKEFPDIETVKALQSAFIEWLAHIKPAKASEAIYYVDSDGRYFHEAWRYFYYDCEEEIDEEVYMLAGEELLMLEEEEEEEQEKKDTGGK